MPTNPTLDALAAEIARTTDIEQSAIALITGFAARMQAAVDAALAGGATSEQLAPVTQEIADLRAKSDALAEAVAANITP